MDDIPPRVDKRVRRALKELKAPWEWVKKRDHYFVKIGDRPLICVANNSSRKCGYQTMKTLERIKKADTE